jgi:multicomponent K+:H+ antiporter subunit D
LIIGMPPLSGFIGKLSLFSALVNPLAWASGDADVARPWPGGTADPLGLASLIAFHAWASSVSGRGRTALAGAAPL